MPREKHHPELLSNISIFVQVGQSPSFTDAARRLNISASGVSRSIARLEQRLGTQLVSRTTRHLSLTPEGAVYFERCKQILQDLTRAEDALKESQAEPTGRLNVRLPKSFGRAMIVPALAEFSVRNQRRRHRLLHGLPDPGTGRRRSLARGDAALCP